MQAADEQRAARVLPGHAVDSQMYTDAAYDSSESTANVDAAVDSLQYTVRTGRG